MRLVLLCVGAVLVWLSGCAPHPLDGFDRVGEAPGGEHRFRVHWNAEAAQATRLNRAWRPDYGGVVRGAVIATEAVTGCAATPGRGDVALVKMALDCRAPP